MTRIDFPKPCKTDIDLYFPNAVKRFCHHFLVSYAPPRSRKARLRNLYQSKELSVYIERHVKKLEFGLPRVFLKWRIHFGVEEVIAVVT